MGPSIRAVFAVSWVLAATAARPGVARAQAAPPAATFPQPAAPPAGAAPAPTPAPDVVFPPPAAPAAAPAAQAPAAPPPAPPPAAPPPAAPPPAYPGAYPYPSPPPGYAYGYYYPPPPPEPDPAPPRFANDAATASSPFFDAIVVVADWQHRFSEVANLGVQGGVYVARRLRLSGKLAFPTEGSNDVQADLDAPRAPTLFYAFSAGYAAVRTPTFVMSPGLMLARTDVNDYGTMLGLSLPLDWVLRSGLRLGLEGGLGRAFGGQRSVSCSTPGAEDCNQRPKYEDREGGTALWLQFHLGFGLNHPGPMQPTAAPPR